MNYEDTCLVKGKYYLVKYKYIPSEFILKKFYCEKNEEISKFFNENKDEVLERAKSTYSLPVNLDVENCVKNKYLTKEVANYEMKRIQSFITHDYKPIRSYYCSNCSSWHLTSKTNEILEKFEEN